MIGPMPEPSRPGRRVGRRTVLLAAVGSASVLAGCGVRLESDAPDLPFLPRRPVPGEDVLVAAAAGSAALAVSAGAAGSTPLLSTLATLHGRQHQVLVAALRARRVPDDVITPPSPMESDTPSTSATPSPSAASASADEAVAALAAAEGAGLADPGRFDPVDAALRPTLAALLAQRYAATVLLGGRPPQPPSTDPRVASASPASPASPATPATPATPAGPAGGPPVPWPDPAAVVPLLVATRAAAYGLEVVAAQAARRDATLARGSLAAVRSLAAQQRATVGGAAPAPALGYELPFPVHTPAAARRLALEVLTRLRESYGAALAPLGAGAPQATFAHLPWWLGRVEVLTHRWGADLAPFPGLA